MVVDASVGTLVDPEWGLNNLCHQIPMFAPLPELGNRNRLY